MQTDSESCAELNAAREIAPLLASRAREFEDNRKIAPELMQQMFDAGMVQMAVPKVYGGRESPLVQILQVIEEIAWGDASASWCLMNYQTTAFAAGLMSSSAAQETFGGSESAVPAGVLALTGRAQQIGEGLLVSGRWSFASGCDHANWLMGTVIVEDDAGEPLKDENGATKVLHPFFSRDQFDIVDNWDVSGLRASGSHDVTVNEVTVPANRWVSLSNPIVVDTPLYRFPIVSTFPPCVAMVALGAARAALDYFIDLASNKVPAGGTQSLGERASAQINVAKAEALIDSSRAYILETVRALWDDVTAGVSASQDKKRRIRLAGVHGAQAAATAVTLLYDAAGSTSIALDCPLQRTLRDIRVATQHLQVSSAGIERMGKLRLTGSLDGAL